MHIVTCTRLDKISKYVLKLGEIRKLTGKGKLKSLRLLDLTIGLRNHLILFRVSKLDLLNASKSSIQNTQPQREYTSRQWRSQRR